MASLERSTTNGQPILDFKPVHMSLTDGTSIPSAYISPPLSPISIARPPTPGRGPLSSHPATPVNGGSYFPPPPTSKPSTTTPKSSTDTDGSRGRVDSVFRSPLSPISPNVQPIQIPKLRRRDSFGIRKLLSLSSLRNSIAGNSHTDLTLQRTNTTGLENLSSRETFKDHKRRPSSPALYSPSVHSTNSSSSSSRHQPSYQTTVQGGASTPQPPELRKRKSGSWFRRKSAIFFMEEDMDEDSQRDDRPKTALKISAPIYDPATPPPSLPQVDALRGGNLTDGAFTGDDVFTKIGR